MKLPTLSLCVLLLLYCPSLSGAPAPGAERRAAARFLSALDPGLAGQGGRPMLLAHARAAGVNLNALGSGWYEAFMREQYTNPAPPPECAVDGLFVGEDKGWVWFALPLGPRGGRPVPVWRDGVVVPRGDLKFEVAPDGRSTLVYLRNTGGFQWGALVTVVGPGGRAHSARRPADDLHLSCETTIARHKKRTRIHCRPRARRTGPDGAGAPPPGKGKGPRCAVRLKDEDGFFTTLFRSIGQAGFSLVLGTATGLILTAATAGNSRIVRVDPGDGSCTLDVPTEAYDKALNPKANRGAPITAATIARAFTPVVVMEARASSRNPTGKTLRVVRAWSASGSLTALAPGHSVAFCIQGWTAPPTVAATSVALFEDGAQIGFLTVLSVTRPDDHKCCTVQTRLPPYTSTLSGDLLAEVRLRGQRSNRVPLGLSPTRVEVTVLRPLVAPGNRVPVLLRSVSGRAIRGTLLLTGPGRFSPSGGSSVTVDTEGPQAYVYVLAAAVGRIDVRFEPKR